MYQEKPFIHCLRLDAPKGMQPKAAHSLSVVYSSCSFVSFVVKIKP
jgi:hypothetical protein